MKKLFGRGLLVLALLATALSFGASNTEAAVTYCSKAGIVVEDSNAKTKTLTADCTTTVTIEIPNGYTFVGDGHTITAADSQTRTFNGAVLQNEAGATEVHVTGVKITTLDLNTKDTVYGILFHNTSGSITNSEVDEINMPDDLAGEARAIFVNAEPQGEEHPNTRHVTIQGNKVTNFQKSGIEARGDVDAIIDENVVSASVAQEHLAANSIEVVFGATGQVTNNEIEGNQWLKKDDEWNATAILIHQGSNITVCNNTITGNSDIAIDITSKLPNEAEPIMSTNNVVCNNTISDANSDTGLNGDVGIRDLGANTSIYGNTATGFDIPVVNSYNKLCFTLWTGALYLRDDCADWQDSFQLATYHAIGEPGAITDFEYVYDSFTLCARDGSGEARWVPGPNPSCETLWNWWDEEEMSYPNTSLISICVNDDTGRVRVVDVGTSCQLDEWAGQI